MTVPLLSESLALLPKILSADSARGVSQLAGQWLQSKPLLNLLLVLPRAYFEGKHMPLFVTHTSQGGVSPVSSPVGGKETVLHLVLVCCCSYCGNLASR